MDTVMLAYADCNQDDEARGYRLRNLDFRLGKRLPRDVAATIMGAAVPGGYNYFTADIIKALPPLAEVDIAREGSVCLYVSNATLQECEALKADECDQQKDGTVRLWWD